MDNNQTNGWQLPDDADLPPPPSLQKAKQKVEQTVSMGRFLGSMLDTFLGSVEATMTGLLEGSPDEKNNLKNNKPL